jgi:hypothetical protein
MVLTALCDVAALPDCTALSTLFRSVMNGDWLLEVVVSDEDDVDEELVLLDELAPESRLWSAVAAV